MAKIENQKLPFGSQGIIILGLLISFLFPPTVALSQQLQLDTDVPRRDMKVAFVSNRCAGCHKADGRGGPGYGGYAANLRKTELTHDELVGVITNGRRNRGMPPFKGVMSNEEIDTMATYIKTELRDPP